MEDFYLFTSLETGLPVLVGIKHIVFMRPLSTGGMYIETQNSSEEVREVLPELLYLTKKKKRGKQR